MKHVWYKPGAGHRGGSRRCLRCGMRRRIKSGTKLTWEYRLLPGEEWQGSRPCGQRRQAKIEITGRPCALPLISWRRHRTPESLLEAYLGGKLRESHAPGAVPVEQVYEVLDLPSPAEIIRMGVYAFLDDAEMRVHYWAAASVNPLHLSYVLGHEVGHASGKRLRGRANEAREERRADEYGAAVFLVLQHLLPLIRRGHHPQRAERTSR